MHILTAKGPNRWPEGGWIGAKFKILLREYGQCPNNPKLSHSPKWNHTGQPVTKWLNKYERQQRQSTQTRTVENAAVMQKPQQGHTLHLQNRSAMFANRLVLFLWEAQEEPTWPVSEPACPVSLPSSPREKGKIPNMLKSISAEAKLLVHQKTANNQPQGHVPKVLHMDSELVAPKHPFVHTRTFSQLMPSVLVLMSMIQNLPSI